MVKNAAIIVALCFAAGCTSPHSPARTIKAALAQWKPHEQDAYALDPKLLASEMKIAGEWSFSDHRYFGTTLKFSSSGDGYVALFDAWGCTGKVSLKRKATFTGGIVRLNHPVRDFWPNTYQTLYAVRIGKRDCLIPSPVAKDFETELKTKPNAMPKTWHVLQRQSAAPSSSN